MKYQNLYEILTDCFINSPGITAVKYRNDCINQMMGFNKESPIKKDKLESLNKSFKHQFKFETLDSKHLLIIKENKNE